MDTTKGQMRCAMSVLVEDLFLDRGPYTHSRVPLRSAPRRASPRPSPAGPPVPSRASAVVRKPYLGSQSRVRVPRRASASATVGWRALHGCRSAPCGTTVSTQRRDVCVRVPCCGCTPTVCGARVRRSMQAAGPCTTGQGRRSTGNHSLNRYTWCTQRRDPRLEPGLPTL